MSGVIRINSDKLPDKSELAERAEHLRLMREVQSLESDLKIATIEAQNREMLAAFSLESQVSLSQYGINNLVDPQVWQTDSFGNQYTPYNSWGTREDGRYRPFIETEQDLAEMRTLSRYIVETNLYAKGLLEDLTNFVIGTGLQFLVKPKNDEDDSEALVKEVQKIVDEFVEDNALSGELDREIFRRSRRDGETLLRVHHLGHGKSAVRIIEPEYLIEPGPKDDLLRFLLSMNPNAPYAYEESCWTFGIHTSKQDILTRWGYFIEWEKGGRNWEYVPVSDLIHIRENVDSNIKRGISDFFPVNDLLRKACKLLVAAIDGATMQASIGYIVEYENGVTGAGIERMQAAGADRTRTEPGTGRTQYIKDFESARVLETPQGRKYNAGPLGSPQGPVYMQVLQGALRAIAARWSMPEHMISSDASNNNYASILEAGSPFKKAIEAAQAKFSKRMSQLVWVAVRNSVENGRLAGLGIGVHELQRYLEIDVEGPTPEVAERKEETERNVELVNAGIMSPQTLAAREGLDFDTEQANSEDAPATPGGPAEPGADQVVASAESLARKVFTKNGTEKVDPYWESIFKGYP